jgi:hypothetical protein
MNRRFVTVSKKKPPLLDRILGQMNSVHIKSIPLKFQLILSYVPRSFIGPVLFIFSEETQCVFLTSLSAWCPHKKFLKSDYGGNCGFGSNENNCWLVMAAIVKCDM